MLELIFCSAVTILPDYLVRRLVQGKRFGKELTFFSVWFELRWGITSCIILTVMLITLVFYNHPATSSAISFFRSIPILPEASGRVSDVYLPAGTQRVNAGDPLFKLDSAKQEAALETARKKVSEIEASIVVARADVQGAEGKVRAAEGDYQQALDELRTKRELLRRNANVVAQREIERLQTLVDGRKGSLDAAIAGQQGEEAKLSVQLPAELASAQAALSQAQVDLSKTTVYAGVSGRVEQFILRVGDFVTPIGRPAGILIPTGAGEGRLQAGFGQIEAQVIQPGMIAEAACISKPLSIIPLVVVQVQQVISTGQVQASQQLLEPTQVREPGSIVAFLEPLFNNGLDDVPPGTSCIVNAYSNHHDEIVSPATSGLYKVYLHVIDAVALVHALILRLQALMMPFKILVFGGGH